MIVLGLIRCLPLGLGCSDLIQKPHAIELGLSSMFTLNVYTLINKHPSSTGENCTHTATCPPKPVAKVGETLGRHSPLLKPPGSCRERGQSAEGVVSPQVFSAGLELHRQSKVIISQQESRARYPNLSLCLIIQITTIILRRVFKKSFTLLYHLSHILQKAFESSRPKWSLQWLKSIITQYLSQDIHSELFMFLHYLKRVPSI